MKLDQFVLGIVAVFALIWLVTAVTGLLTAVPYGIIGLIPIAVGVGIIGVVIYQRLTNKEDDYYTKNVDK